jgi:curved DNA-binding protein CbpA
VSRPRSLYDVLNVASDAEPVVIEAAYRALMKKYHPDQAHQSSAAAAHDPSQINTAYAVLRDPSRRAEYDHRLWLRHQAHLMAQAPAAAPARRLGVLGLGGWVVAAGLGCGIGLTLAGYSSFALPVPQRVAAAAAMEEEASVPAPSPEEETAAFLAAHARPAAVRRVEAPVLSARDRSGGIDAGPVELAAERPRNGNPPAKSAGSGSPPGADRDFLEREGFIY